MPGKPVGVSEPGFRQHQALLRHGKPLDHRRRACVEMFPGCLAIRFKDEPGGRPVPARQLNADVLVGVAAHLVQGLNGVG